MKEIVSDEVFNFVNTHCIIPDGTLTRAIRENEADCLILSSSFCTYHLEEARWDNNLIFANSSRVFRNNGATTDPNLAMELSPSTATAFKLLPLSCIDLMILWADIREIKTFVHRLLTPLHVSRRSHVATIIARPAIIIS